MPKNIIYFLIFISIILVIVFIFSYKKNNSDFQNLDIIINNQKYNLEIARTLPQKSLGLSNRNQLCPNCGMIFLFAKDGIQPFWMKDTFIHLDMIWVNSKGKVTDIISANETNSTKILQNTKPAKYVIELNLNEAKKINLKIGDTIDLSNLSDQ